jgi:hypothetical protein
LSIPFSKKIERGGRVKRRNPVRHYEEYAGTLLHLSVEDKLPAVDNQEKGEGGGKNATPPPRGEVLYRA